MSELLGHLNTAETVPKEGDVLVINRKVGDPNHRILCRVRKVVQGPHSPEIILSAKNDYFIWNMYQSGKSWVWRVWNLGPVEITAITNTTAPFPRR